MCKFFSNKRYEQGLVDGFQCAIDMINDDALKEYVKLCVDDKDANFYKALYNSFTHIKTEFGRKSDVKT